jgi:hypothetical protein
VGSYIAFNGDALLDLATKFLKLAEKQGKRTGLMVGHRVVGTSLFLTGEPTKCRAHLDQALALYDSSKDRLLTTRFGQDLSVAILSYRSLALCTLGYPEAAMIDSDRAVLDIEIWLAPLAGTRFLVPYRASMPTPMGTGILQATRFVPRPLKQ